MEQTTETLAVSVGSTAIAAAANETLTNGSATTTVAASDESASQVDTRKRERLTIIIAGVVIGVIASLLVLAGNPSNMGFCIACFIRDTVGALGLQTTETVQYIRPEIMGLVLGAFIMSLVKGEHSARGGSAPLTRFVLGFCAMVGCLVFLGCPFRMILRIAGGDLNAVIGLIGFALGIFVGTLFLRHGYSLGRTHKLPKSESFIWPAVQVALLVLLIAAPSFIYFSESGPASLHAAVIISLAAGLVVGAIAQRTRLCMVGGIRDMILFKEPKLLLGFVGVLVGAFVCNLILQAVTGDTYFTLSFADQPIAHTDGVWNFLGMFLVGLACCLLGGCPLRQLVLSGEGNSDSAMAILGLAVGAAFCHNFGLASSTDGPTTAGKVAVVICLAVVLVIACTNTFGKKQKA